MLTELSEYDDSDESVDLTRLSFDIRTRSEEGDELVQREYSFSHSKEWNEWHLHQFTEKRCDYDSPVSRRNWSIERDVFWSDGDAADVDIPANVTRQLNAVLDSDIRMVHG